MVLVEEDNSLIAIRQKLHQELRGDFGDNSHFIVIRQKSFYSHHQ